MAGESLSFWVDPVHARRNLRLLRTFFWSSTIAAGFLQAWSARFWLSPDPINYLDIASAYLRGEWKSAVNAYWSPVFSWLLALCLGLFRPNAYWESTLLHLLNLGGLLVALRCFEFFFRSFLRIRTRFDAVGSEKFGDLVWWALGYGLFLSTSLFVLSNSSTTTPDVWVSAATYIASGLLLRIRAEGGGWRLFVTLGFVLGCAYLTKTFYFPLSFVFLVTAALSTGSPRKTLQQAVLGLAVFGLVAGPWVAALSLAKHRFTYGDVGAINYAVVVDRLPQPWRGENGTGTPKHPLRQLLSKPKIYEFVTPDGEASPPGLDWSYWMEGLQPHFDLRGQLSALRQSFGTFVQIALIQIEYGVGLLILFFLASDKRGWITSFRRLWYFWIPPLAACLSYALVRVEGRFVAPFVLLLWVAAFACLIGAAPEISGRTATAIVLAILSATGLRVAKSMETNVVACLSRQENLNWEVSEGLRALGIHPGDRVSTVSGIPSGEEDVFWAADDQTKRRVFEAFASTGARIAVTEDPPPGAINEDWLRLGKTNLYGHLLPPHDPTKDASEATR